MFLKSFPIDPKAPVTDIVKRDYRTADVFRKYGISYCCGGKWPLEMVCSSHDLDLDSVITELESAMRSIPVSNQLDFNAWNIEFTIDYIVNVHHQYLKNTLPSLKIILQEFATEHRKKFEYVSELEKQFGLLAARLSELMDKEENTLFTYIRHISHAYRTRESFGHLIIRTLRKPIDETMSVPDAALLSRLHAIRNITNDYTPPEKACPSHQIIFAKLKELDHDLVHHLFLEQSILYPKLLALESEFNSKS